jgi:hypothetical protein
MKQINSNAIKPLICQVHIKRTFDIQTVKDEKALLDQKLPVNQA